MRYILFSIISILHLTSILSQDEYKGCHKRNFYIGDTIYIAAYLGLNIRAEPNTKSEVFSTAKFRDKLILENLTNHIEEIEKRPGRWIKVKYNGVEGFVFSGFISKFPFPKIDEVDCNRIVGFDKLLDIENIDNPIDKETIKFHGDFREDKEMYRIEYNQYENGNSINYYTGYEFTEIMVLLHESILFGIIFRTH